MAQEDTSTTPGGPALDGIVEGTDAGELIDTSYTGDPDGDKVENGEAVYGSNPDDDIIKAGGGNDTIEAGAGGDNVYAGDGDDLIDGGEGYDRIQGEYGDDTILGGLGDEVIGGEDADGEDVDVLDLTGAAETANPGGSLEVVYDADDPEAGTVRYYDADGNFTGSTRFTEIEKVVPCFTPGTLIATPKGEVRVEDMKAGDRVITRDNGIQEIRWTGRRTLAGGDLARAAHLLPVQIRQGALGNGLPERDMMVSPNHRVLVANDKTALYFEDREVLVAAKHLTGLQGVETVAAASVTYIHFMFDQHEVVLSDGAWTESFQPGDQTLRGLDNAQRTEIFELFPDLKTAEGRGTYAAARRSLKKHEAQLLVH